MWKGSSSLLVAMLSLAPYLAAEVPDAAIELALRATAVIDGTGQRDTPQKWYLATCVHPDGYFVTVCDRGRSPNYAPRKLILSPNQVRERKVVMARVHHIDTNRGIVVLKADGAGLWPALPLAPTDLASATWTFLTCTTPTTGRDAEEDPYIRVTGRTYPDGKLVSGLTMHNGDDRLGAPILDAGGRLAGITGVHHAGWSTDVLRQVLSFPKPRMTTRCVRSADLHVERQFTITIPVLLPNAAKYVVQVTLDDGTGERAFVARPSINGLYAFSATPAADLTTRATTIDCRMMVLQEAKLVAEARETILVAQPQTELEPLRRRPLPVDPLEIELPNGRSADDVIPAGGGRFLLFYFQATREVAVLDLNQMKIRAVWSIESVDPLIVGGVRKVCIVRRDVGLIDRYDLATLQRDLTSKLPDDRPIEGASMGYASEGPVLTLVKNKGPDRHLVPRLIDPMTLRLIAAEFFEADRWIMSIVPVPELRAVPDGSAFLAWQNNWSFRMTPMSGLIEGRCPPQGGHMLLPSLDGRTVFSAHRRLDDNLRVVEAGERDTLLLPSYHPSFHIALRGAKNWAIGDYKSAVLTFSVHSTQSSRQLLEREPFPELLAGAPTKARLLSLEKRVHLFPQADLLVTVNAEGNKAVLRRIDVTDLMTQANVDFLMLESLPPLQAFRGERWEYQPHVRSRKGDVQVLVRRGPKGMSADNRSVVWVVPSDFPEDEADVSLVVKDASTQEVLQTFRIQVR